MGLSGHFRYGSSPIAVGAAPIVDDCERAKRLPGGVLQGCANWRIQFLSSLKRFRVFRSMDKYLFTSRHDQQQVRPDESTRIAQSNRPLAAPTQIGGKETTKIKRKKKL